MTRFLTVLRLAAVAACLIWLPAPGSADTLTVGFGHPLGAGSCITPAGTSAPTGPLSDSQNCSAVIPTLGNVAASVAGTADYGLLRSAIELSTQAEVTTNLENSGTTFSQFTGSYVLTGAGSQVTTRLNFDISGLILLDALRDGSASMTLKVDFGGILRQAIVGVNTNNGGAATPILFGNDLSLAAPWLTLATPSGSAFSFETENYTVPLNVPVPLTVTLSTGGGMNSGGHMVTNFGSTLTFSTHGDTFTLPDGFGANGAGVVDNQWIGATATVPEVSSWILLATGFAGIVLIRRRASTS